MNEPKHLFGRLHEAIRSAKRILLVAHQKPDGDTLGSSSSVLNWLIREDKDVTVFCADVPPTAFRYIDNIHRYSNDPAVFDGQYDLVIVFDSGDLKYCGVADHMPRLVPGYFLANVDHHITNVHFGDLNIVLLDASSTAEVIHRFYEANQIHVDDRMATSLLTGLLTDTSSFSNAATNPVAVDAASKLLSAGARAHDIARHLLHDKSIDGLRLWGLVLSRLHHNKTDDVVSTYLLQKDTEHVPNDVIEGVSNFLSAVNADTDTVLFLRELPGGKVKGSFRSVSRDVSAIAKLIGGGGHKKAAGFTVEGRIEETVEGAKIVAASN
jgi:phosphoesterase RecJ-like protein